MREIKFRAWDRYEKRIIDADSWFFNDSLEPFVDSVAMARNKYDIMQYTGLVDKAGTSICEGDIVKWRYMNNDLINEVLFQSGCFVVGRMHPVTLRDLMKADRQVEVIGNIYQNGDLLK